LHHPHRLVLVHQRECGKDSHPWLA
jgi:hypothetical protein